MFRLPFIFDISLDYLFHSGNRLITTTTTTKNGILIKSLKNNIQNFENQNHKKIKKKIQDIDFSLEITDTKEFNEALCTQIQFIN